MPRLLLRLLLRFRLDVPARSVSGRIQWFGGELLLKRGAPPAGAAGSHGGRRPARRHHTAAMNCGMTT